MNTNLKEKTMKTILKTVNENGLAQIHTFLAEKHKKGGDHFNNEMLRAWAHDAEFSLAEGNNAGIEIRSFDAVSGHTETFTISEEGLDSKIIEIE